MLLIIKFTNQINSLISDKMKILITKKRNILKNGMVTDLFTSQTECIIKNEKPNLIFYSTQAARPLQQLLCKIISVKKCEEHFGRCKLGFRLRDQRLPLPGIGAVQNKAQMMIVKNKTRYQEGRYSRTHYRLRDIHNQSIPMYVNIFIVQLI